MSSKGSSRKPVPRASTILWVLPFAALLVFAAVWGALGLCWADAGSIAVFVLVALVGGALASQRERVLAVYDALPAAVRAVRDVLVLAVSAVLAACALELAWNAEFSEISPMYFALECLFALLVLAALYFLCMRRGAAPAAGVAAFALVGVAQYFVLSFKGSVILPSDLYALGTAAAVSGGYRYGIDSGVLNACTCVALAWCLLAFVRPSLTACPRLRFAPLVNVVAGIAIVGGAYAMVELPNYAVDLGVDMNYWWAVNRYQAQGMLVTFNTARQDLAIHVPEGYTEQAAAAAEEELAARYRSGAGAGTQRKAAEQQFAQEHPTVIAVMNEAFADLSTLEELHVGYKGPEFFNTAEKGVLARGSFAVPVLGGGTCNTEFEFLTGHALACMGQGKYPYSMYSLETCSSLAAQLRALGYKTSAMHPNYAENWNRDKRYAELGFEAFYAQSAFAGKPRYHNGVTDAATYEKILELLEEDSAPQFIFDVTMQNHGGYTKGDTPEDQLLGLAPQGIDESTTAQLNEYAACIAASDRDLEWFVGELRTLKRPVVLVFFGDHHPNFSRTLNDALCVDDTNETAHDERIFQTSYLVWANYEVAGAPQADPSERDDTAAFLLGAHVYASIGVPLTQFQEAQLGLRDSVRSFNAHGYLGADDVWRPLDADSAYKPALDAFSLAEYREFGAKME